MKMCLLLSVLLLASCCHFSLPDNAPPENLVYPAIALIAANDYNCVGYNNIGLIRKCLNFMTEPGGPTVGTAFWISEHLIMTVQHVALYADRDLNSRLIVSLKGEYHKKIIIDRWYYPGDIDAAIGYVAEPPKHKVLRICGDIYEGELATLYGRSPDLGPEHVAGQVVGVYGSSIVLTAAVRSGYSGGPIISDARGCVLGLTASVRNSKPPVTYGISAEFLQAFLDAYNVTSSIPKTSR